MVFNSKSQSQPLSIDQMYQICLYFNVHAYSTYLDLSDFNKGIVYFSNILDGKKLIEYDKNRQVFINVSTGTYVTYSELFSSQIGEE